MRECRKVDRARVAVLISGRGSNMAALVYAAKWVDCPFEIVLVIADREDAAGLLLARAEGVHALGIARPAFSEKTAFFSKLDAAIRDADAEWIALAGFMRVLPGEFVTRWQDRILNIHPSLLPKYKGLDTHARALAAGDEVAGCSVHLVTEAVDDGPVLGRTQVAVLTGDTPDTLAARVLIAEHQLYARVLADHVTRERDTDWILARVGALALALPETDARSSHGAPGWRVGGDKSGKFFAYVSINHHGEEAVALLVKTSGADEMAELIDAEPDIYFRPAYYGASGWIAYRLDRKDVDWDHVADWLGKSWRAVAPRGVVKRADAFADF